MAKKKDIVKNGDSLTEKEKKLLEIIRATEYGEIKITIQDKQPVSIDELKKSIKL